MRFVGSALAAGVVLMAATLALGQSAGGLTVEVTDETGMPLPGATVTLGSDRGLIKTTAALTNVDGVVQFPVLSPGPGYWVEISFPSYASIRDDKIDISIGENEKLRVQLNPELTERVVVVADRDVIDLEQNEVTTKFSDEFINDLPVPGRSYTNVIAMAPGVQDADGDGNPNVHGSRNRDFSTMVGGVRNVDPLTGQKMSDVNPNSIEEMEVITAGAGVEFGRAQGGFANIVQKQGSNEMEGVFELYLSTSKLDGSGANDTNTTSDPEYDSYEPSIHLSGPILRDKLWYVLSHKYTHLDEPRDIVTEVVVVPRRAWTHADTLTWQISPRNKLDFTFQADPEQISFLGTARGAPPETTIDYERSAETYTMNWTAPFSPKILVESTAAWQELNLEYGPTQTGVPNNCLSNVDAPFLALAQCTDVSKQTVSGSFPTVYTDRRQRLSVNGVATIFAGEMLGATHTFQVGMGVENERYFREQIANPSIQWVIRQDSIGQGPDAELRTIREAFTNVFVPSEDASRVSGTNWTVFGEDQFKPFQNLTVTLGLRLDREEINSEGREIIDAQGEFAAFQRDWETLENILGSDILQASIWPNYFTLYENVPGFREEIVDLTCTNNPGCSPTLINQEIQTQDFEQVSKVRRATDREIYNTNFSPRLAVGWLPWANGKTVLRAAAGRYYNLTPLTLTLAEIEPDQAQIVYSTESCDPDDNNCVPQIVPFTPALTVQPVDPDYETAYQDELFFVIERQLWAETSLTVRYINRRYRDQPQDENLNIATGDFGTCLYQTAGTDQNDRHPWIALSPGAGDAITDPYTGEVFFDTDPGFGDGRIDDCVGRTDSFTDMSKPKPGQGQGAEDNTVILQRADGRPDLYTQNPLWQDIYLIGNINSVDYDAFEVVLDRRQYRSWEGSISYTWSEAFGDGEDYNQAIGDDPSLDDVVQGYQSYDIRHSVKLTGTTITPWGIRLGTFITWTSGLPYSIIYQQRFLDAIPPSLLESGPFDEPPIRVRQWYPTNERNDQRNPSWWNMNLRAAKEIPLSRGMNMQVAAEIFNVFADDTYSVWNPDTEVGVQVNGTDRSATRRFGREWTLSMKLNW